MLHCMNAPHFVYPLDTCPCTLCSFHLLTVVNRGSLTVLFLGHTRVTSPHEGVIQYLHNKSKGWRRKFMNGEKRPLPCLRHLHSCWEIVISDPAEAKHSSVLPPCKALLSKDPIQQAWNTSRSHWLESQVHASPLHRQSGQFGWPLFYRPHSPPELS